MKLIVNKRSWWAGHSAETSGNKTKLYEIDDKHLGVGQTFLISSFIVDGKNDVAYIELAKTIDNSFTRFGFKILKKKLFSLELEIFGEGLFKAKNDIVAPCKIKLRKNKECNFYRFDNNNHIVYIITLANDNVCFKNIKHNEELMNSKEFQEFAKKMDKKVERKNSFIKS